MTPRKMFSDADIINAAFAIARESGYQEVSARSIAARLGCSTMPIYTSLSSMANLEEQVKTKAYERLVEYQSATYGDNPLLDSAIGYVMFAREEIHLFRLLFVENPVRVPKEQMGSLARIAQEQQEKGSLLHQIFETIPDRNKNGFVMKSWVFIHGLATLINAGVLAEMDKAHITSLIESAGAAFYLFDSQHNDNEEFPT